MYILISTHQKPNTLLNIEVICIAARSPDETLRVDGRRGEYSKATILP